MLSFRCLALLALIAAAAAFPPLDIHAPQPIDSFDEDLEPPWLFYPLFGDDTFPRIEDVGPRVISDGDKYQVIIEVEDYEKSELKVMVKEGVVFVKGSHKGTAKEGDGMFASQFSHSYTLPSNASSTSVRAELSTDGFLVITAPIRGHVDRSEETDRDVPIVSAGAPYNKEETPEVAPAASEDPALEEAPVMD